MQNWHSEPILQFIQPCLTPFYALDYNRKTNEEKKAEAKKGFYVPLYVGDGLGDNLFFAALIIDESETQQKRCKAAGTIKFSQIKEQFEKKEKKDSDKNKDSGWEQLDMKLSPTRDLNFTAIEILSKSLGDGFGEGSEVIISTSASKSSWFHQAHSMTMTLS